jgi:hypothetical protein
MFKQIVMQEAQLVVGGNGYIYKCWDKQGKEYWDNKPNSAGCTNTQTGRTEKGSGKGSSQRGGK